MAQPVSPPRRLNRNLLSLSVVPSSLPERAQEVQKFGIEHFYDSCRETLKSPSKQAIEALVTTCLKISVERFPANTSIGQCIEQILDTPAASSVAPSLLKTLRIALAFFQGSDPIANTEESLGAGGFGSVKGVLILGEPHVVKTVRGKKNHHLQREQRALAELKHPHIISMVFQQGMSLYLERADGTLAEYLEQGKVSARELPSIFQQLASALAYMHGEGYMHGDVKAANVLLKEGRVKLADFGTTKKIEEFSYEQKGIESSIYSPPEHLKQEILPASPDCQKIDIWAFGALIWGILKQEQYQYPCVMSPSSEPGSSSKGTPLHADELGFQVSIMTVEEAVPMEAQIDQEKCQKYDPRGVLRTVMARCLNLIPQERPSMFLVAEELSKLV